MRPRVFVNAGGSVSGGGKVYVLGFLDELERGGDRGLDWVFLVPKQLGRVTREAPSTSIEVRRQPIERASRRFVWEQTLLPVLKGVRDTDVLVSAANFGPLLRRTRHVVIARNVLHFQPSEIRGSKGRRLALQAILGRLSVARATVVVTATEAMAGAVAARTGRHPIAIPFGPGLVRGRTEDSRPRFTFLDRSWWGPHKRLGDLLVAVRHLARTHAGRFVVRSACDPTTRFARGFEESEADRRLLADPAIASHVELQTFDPRPGEELDGDAIVVAGTTESFCFPLAEAIGAQLPVVAADCPFARELCGDAAFYTPGGDSAALADAMRRLIEGRRPPPFPQELRRKISWTTHVDRMAELCRVLATAETSR